MNNKKALQKSLKELEKAVTGFNVELALAQAQYMVTDQLGELIMKGASKADVKKKWIELARLRA